MTFERLVSACFAIGVGFYAVYLQPTVLLLAAIVQVAFPLAAIWYHDELSTMTEYGKFDSVTPTIFIRILGWILLLMTPVSICVLKWRLEM